MTFDVENVPVDAVAAIAATKPFLPPVAALGASQDRLLEKTLFRQLKIPTPAFAAVDSLADLQAAIAKSAARRAQDTTARLRRPRPVPSAQAARTPRPPGPRSARVPLIYEQFVNFSREVSIIGVRSTRGETRFYPLAANMHSDGHPALLDRPVSPCARCRKQAETLSEAAAAPLRLRRRADHRILRAARPAGRERDGAARAQLRPLDHRRRARPASSRITCARSRACRSAARRRVGHSRHDQSSSATCRTRGTLLRVPGVHLHDYGKEPRPSASSATARSMHRLRAARDRALKQLLRLQGRLIASDADSSGSVGQFRKLASHIERRTRPLT